MTRNTRATAYPWVLVLLTAAALVLAAVVNATPARAADLSNFRPGAIISDAIFFDSTTMSAGAVDAFLDAKGASCVAGAMPCLKDYTQSTTTKPADARCTGTYVGGSNESAGTIIVKVAQACGINPQVLVVMLQKEQGLVTATRPSQSRYDKAMGFACPDTAACDTTYYGFFTQVYKAAWQLRNYTLNPTRYNYRAGVTNTILYNPNQACGNASVYIENQATADLYIYTPYTPNAAALAAGYGTGDSCSAYGNRNFYNYFNDWFGPSNDRAPIGVIDSFSSTDRSITVAGWALDPDTTAPIAVHVYVDGVATAVTASASRPDVDAVYHKGANHGFSVPIDAAPGAHEVCVWALNDWSSGTNPSLGCRVVTVVDQTPIGTVERVEAAPGAIEVAGWGFDPDTSGAANVEVTVDGASTAVAASVVRTDVPGRSGPSGFDATVAAGAGSHRVCATVVDSAAASQNLALGCWTAVVGPSVAASGKTGVVPVALSRVLDTWVSVAAAGPRCFALTGAGVPAGATGAFVNVTAVGPSAGGNVVVYPQGAARPTASTVNFEVGTDVASGAWVALGPGARMCWAGQGAGSVRVVVDVSAFTTTGSAITTLAPIRVLDTRPASRVGGLSAIPPLTPVTVQAAGVAGVPADAKAVVVTVAAIEPQGVGNLRLYSSSLDQPPYVATLQYAPRQTKSNSAIVPIGPDGRIAVYSDTFGQSVDVLMDVTGYVAASASSYVSSSPTRILDTRPSAEPVLRPFGTLNAGQTGSLDVHRLSVVPSGATAVVLTVTVSGPTGPGNLRVFPDGAGDGSTTPPSGSSINYITGRDISNTVVVGVPSSGRVAFFDDQLTGSRADVVVDVVGYLVG